jgi:superfamily II DNA or RNA helicase
MKVTLTNKEIKLDGELPSSVVFEIITRCSYAVDGADKSPLYKKGRWDGTRKLFDARNRKAPIGLSQTILSILGNANIQYELEDKRNTTKGFGKLDVATADESIELRDYQTEAVNMAITNKVGVLNVATGGGKTVIASKLIASLKCNTLFMVHTKDLMYQTIQSFEEVLCGTDSKIGQLGDGVTDIQPITVATTQTVSKILGIKYTKTIDGESNEKESKISRPEEVAKYVKSLDLVIWDEVHRIACEMATSIAKKLNCHYRIGLSASPWRDDGATLEIESAIGPEIFKLSASELILRGFLVKPFIQFKSIEPKIQPQHDFRTYDQVYRQEITENAVRNQIIVDQAINWFNEGRSFLILVRTIKHGNTLKRMIKEQYHPIEFLSGRDSTEKRNNTIQLMRDGEVIGLIASVIADEGLDIKRLSGAILAGGGKSSTRALQRVGRVLRPHPDKKDAFVVDFMDKANYLEDHAKRRMSIYQTEEEFEIFTL